MRATTPRMASAVWPASIVPMGSIVPDTITGTGNPISLRQFFEWPAAPP